MSDPEAEEAFAKLNISPHAKDWSREDFDNFYNKVHMPSMKKLTEQLSEELKKELAVEKAKAEAGGWPVDLSLFPEDYDVEKEENTTGQCEYRQALLDVYIDARLAARAQKRATLRAEAAARKAEEQRLKREATLWGRVYNYLFCNQKAVKSVDHADGSKTG